MTRRKPNIIKIIRKSCLTGKAVWVSHERAYLAEWKAYKNACRQEINRVKSWSRTIGRRKSNILAMLNDLTANIPIVGNIPARKKDSARLLRLLAETQHECYKGFYHHIIAERCGHKQTKPLFEGLRNKKNNRSYVK